jgi:hypothetical protein
MEELNLSMDFFGESEENELDGLFKSNESEEFEDDDISKKSKISEAGEMQQCV